MSNTREVSILSIDAWAEGEDGWNWNMWTKLGSVDVTHEPLYALAYGELQ